MKKATITETDKAAFFGLLTRAAQVYPRVATGPYLGCKHPAAVLRYALTCGNDQCARLARNFITSGHGAGWNALEGVLPTAGWLVWYGGA
jgi:hypothetical protein